MPRQPKPDTTLLGSYRTPRVKVGNTIACAIVGEVEVDGITTDVPIPWPYRKLPGGYRALIVCADLAKAIRRESVESIIHHWGVS